jgi:hypothetical protein
MAPISKEDKIADLFKALCFGNYKGALSQPELLLKLISGSYSQIHPPPSPQQNHTNPRHLHGIIEHPTTMDNQQTW